MRSQEESRHNAAVRLPQFPRPYPGESFYSVLCRYHVRSGDINDWYTRMQLFGYNASLYTTLLSSTHLEFVNVWLPESSGITAESMLVRNTVFPLYCLQAWPFERKALRAEASESDPQSTSACTVQHKMIHPSGYLRYCPCCAEEQRRLYGEAYWQILPQLNGMEYCPKHGTPYRDSPVTVESIRFHFFPASTVLNGLHSDLPGNPCDPFSGDTKKVLLRLSQDMSWIFHNNTDESIVNEKAVPICRMMLDRSEMGRYWIRKDALLRRLPCLAANKINAYMLRQSRPGLAEDYMYCFNLPVYVMALLMGALCGSAEEFCTYLSDNKAVG